MEAMQDNETPTPTKRRLPAIIPAVALVIAAALGGYAFGNSQSSSDDEALADCAYALEAMSTIASEGVDHMGDIATSVSSGTSYDIIRAANSASSWLDSVTVALRTIDPKRQRCYDAANQ